MATETLVAAAPRDVAREVERWKRRAKKLLTCAREAQFELLAKTIHHAALISVITPEEYAEFKRRIRADIERRKAARAERPQ